MRLGRDLWRFTRNSAGAYPKELSVASGLDGTVAVFYQLALSRQFTAISTTNSFVYGRLSKTTF